MLPEDFSDDLARELLDATGATEADLSVAWSRPVPDDVDRTFGFELTAIRVRGTDAQRLRGIVLANGLLVGGVEGNLGTDYPEGEGDDRKFMYAGDRAVATSGDTLYLITFEPPYPEEPATQPFSESDLRDALGDLDPIGPPPEIGPMPSPATVVFGDGERDVAAEALLPTDVEGVGLFKTSAKGRAVLSNALLAAPAMILVALTGTDASELSAAAGMSEGAGLLVCVVRVPGSGRRALLGAMLEFGALNGPDTVETIEVDGRVAVILEDNVLYAVEGALYWAAHSTRAGLVPGGAWRDTAIAVIRALPDP